MDGRTWQPCNYLARLWHKLCKSFKANLAASQQLPRIRPILRPINHISTPPLQAARHVSSRWDATAYITLRQHGGGIRTDKPGKDE